VSRSQSQKRRRSRIGDLREIVREAWFQKAIGKRRAEEIANIVEHYYNTYGRSNIRLNMDETYRLGSYLLLYYTYLDSNKLRCIICGNEVRNDAFEIVRHFIDMHGPVVERLVRKVFKR